MYSPPSALLHPNVIGVKDYMEKNTARIHIYIYIYIRLKSPALDNKFPFGNMEILVV